MCKDKQKPLTKQEFEALLTKAAQPLPLPDQEVEKTSEPVPSDDCSENHTH